MNNYQVKGEYVTINDLNKYQVKGEYVAIDDLKDKLNNYQVKGEYALKTELPNMNNYQTKGNYVAYTNDNKDQLDIENEYLIIRDKNKKPLMTIGNNTSITGNTYINGELNIGDKNNYMNLKKDGDNNCLVIGSVVNNVYSPINKFCPNFPVPIPNVLPFIPSPTYPSNIASPISSPVSTNVTDITYPTSPIQTIDTSTNISNVPQFFNKLENYVKLIPNIQNTMWKTTLPFFNKFEDTNMFTTSEISTTSTNNRNILTIDTTPILDLPFTYLFVFFTVGGTKTNIEMLASNTADLNATSTNNVTMDFTYTTSLSNGAINLMETSNIKKNTMNTKNMPIYIYKITIPELKQHGKFLTFRLVSADGNISTLRICDMVGSNSL